MNFILDIVDLRSSTHRGVHDPKIFIFPFWITTWEIDSSEAVPLSIFLVELLDQVSCITIRQFGVLSNTDLSDPVSKSNLNNFLSGHVSIVATIANDNQGFAIVAILRQGIKDGLDVVFQVILLLELSHLPCEPCCRWLLVIVCLCHYYFDAHFTVIIYRPGWKRLGFFGWNGLGFSIGGRQIYWLDLVLGA